MNLQIKRMRKTHLSMTTTGSSPLTPRQKLESTLVKSAVLPITAALFGGRRSVASDFVGAEGLVADSVTSLGNLQMCRLLNGMWQVSGAHGYLPEKDRAVAEMSHCAGMLRASVPGSIIKTS
jgi:hypothetical protein